jgi:hypothetical protein
VVIPNAISIIATPIPITNAGELVFNVGRIVYHLKSHHLKYVVVQKAKLVLNSRV